MPTEVDGVGGKAMPGEVVEKMHIPTPRAVHHAVDEEQRRLMSALRGASGDDLESHGSPSPKSRSETRQLDTATRPRSSACEGRPGRARVPLVSSRQYRLPTRAE